LGAAGTPPEHRVRCLPPLTKSGGDAHLRLEIDGTPQGVSLCIQRLTVHLVAGLPDRALDLLEIATLVYGVDSAVSRGGPTDQQMGAKWHRRFVVEMPVREPAFWSDPEVTRALEETLMFLSGDRFVVRFVQKTDPEAERSRFFRFDAESAWRATRVLMFSGGLDSLAGALEEIAEQGQRVALVSHFSASKIAPVQRALHKALAARFGPDRCRHIPVQVQMAGRGMKEGTHRSRSFLFAALGAITAQAFGLDRVSFHENGVVSLNLPPVGNVLGTRATRTTHPQTLSRFTDLLGRVFGTGMRVDNPYAWRTKADVVATVARLNMAEQIAHTRSCADVHNQTKQYPHCGRCSQCIDRRFAVLAAGLQRFDPEEAYKVDLMEGARDSVVDREIALSFLRNAQAFEHMTPTELVQVFPAVLDAVGHLGHPPEATLELIARLLQRHGTGVADVMRETLRAGAGELPGGQPAPASRRHAAAGRAARRGCA
jgi:7-cyano-7-deazaguanine synthase in queuosine biosynthesis